MRDLRGRGPIVMKLDIEQIWLDYRSRIKAFLHSKVSNPADVDDLLQEISIKTFTGISSIHGP